MCMICDCVYGRLATGDATKVRDLVRCSLVFDRASDLQTCLDLILNDPRACVAQVKNRFKGSAMETLGYRDVQLKLTLHENCFGESELEMGLHEHVCEVQLHVSAVYALKNNEGHRRYVEYRNRLAM